MAQGEFVRPLERTLMPIRLILVTFATAAACSHSLAQTSASKTDLFALELVVSDLVEAKRMITISEVEKVVAASRKEKGFIEEDFQQAVMMMRRHDENRSNHIESSELFDAPKAGQLAKAVMGRADLNQDGRIDLNELAKYFAAQHKRK